MASSDACRGRLKSLQGTSRPPSLLFKSALVVVPWTHLQTPSCGLTSFIATDHSSIGVPLSVPAASLSLDLRPSRWVARSPGYMVARTLAAAPTIATSIVEQLTRKRRERDGEREGVAGSKDDQSAAVEGYGGDDVSAAVWSEAWPVWRKDQRDFFCFGMEVLLKVGGGHRVTGHEAVGRVQGDGARGSWEGAG